MSVQEFWDLGHEITKHNTQMSGNVGLRIFKEFFGTNPEVCKILFDLISPQHDGILQPKYLLWALLFIKQYQTEAVISALIDVTEKTARNWIWILLEYIQGVELVRIQSYIKALL
jgi:hypothetical protein